ncbi:hypothetical protein MIND_00557400 [Mycena indigotica]|uniref:60S ribosomal protein L21 n=1 Tax=Mycena indigotica TaxID=2126181 RepID=A0A8H6W7F3_9AGAR|nr:uncharacterized protein MIND_00557400 [Mycena indigotica]KAF7307622.1 hypothetical protein MIND_00557400 [Mycena indigotica]
MKSRKPANHVLSDFFCNSNSDTIRKTASPYIIYNVTRSAVGVIVHKVVGNRYLEKRVNLRVEHIRHSKCRQEFLDRVKKNHDAHAEAKEKEKGERVKLKRIPAQPRAERNPHASRLCVGPQGGGLRSVDCRHRSSRAALRRVFIMPEFSFVNATFGMWLSYSCHSFSSMSSSFTVFLPLWRPFLSSYVLLDNLFFLPYSYHILLLLLSNHVVSVGRQIVNVPSFVVRLDAQKHIDFALTSPYGGGPPGRVKRKQAAAAAKEGGDDENEE